MNKTLVLVVGCQRSGTTLVGQILGAHPRAVLVDEEDGLYDWVFERLGKPELVKEPLTWREVCLNAKRKYARPGERFEESGELHDSVAYVVLKSPNLTYSWQEVARTFPGCRVVYLFRDPRAIVASMRRLEVPFVANQARFIRSHSRVLAKYRGIVERWNDDALPMILKMAELAAIKMSFAARFESAGLQLTRVVYERLVENPEKVTRSLLGSVGLDSSLGEKLVHRGAYIGYGPGGTDRTRPVDTRSAQSWRRDLSDADQEAVIERASAVAPRSEWSMLGES